MRVLVACEFSGRVRDAFTKAGHDAMSCDLLPSDTDGPHYQGDILDLLENTKGRWDLMIAHPPCTYLCRSGARWWKAKKEEQAEALNFFELMWSAWKHWEIPKTCVENPIGIPSTVFEKPTQIIQPWMFGHGETKATCLWLHGLPKLRPSCIVEGRDNTVHNLPQTKDRWKKRSITYTGIANAMASQWGIY
jgi:hypothetical protein